MKRPTGHRPPGPAGRPYRQLEPMTGRQALRLQALQRDLPHCVSHQPMQRAFRSSSTCRQAGQDLAFTPVKRRGLRVAIFEAQDQNP